MKTRPKTPNQKFSFTNRFLVGLIVALGLSLTAFEWTTIKYEEKHGDYGYVPVEEVILDPLRFRIEEAEKPEPVEKEKAKTPEIKVVDKIDDPVKVVEPNLDPVPVDKPVIISDLPPEIIVENEIHVTAEFFAHYDNCAGLDAQELFQCTVVDIANRIKKNFVVPNELKYDSGEKIAYLQFVVSKDGEIEDIVVARTNHPKMGEASVMALKKLPKMNPATQKGRNVALKMTVPIKLMIEG